MSTDAHSSQPATGGAGRTEMSVSDPTPNASRSPGSRLATYRRVEWVRAADLMQRAGSRLMEQGTLTHPQLQQVLAAARRDSTEYLRTALREPATNFEPDTPTSTITGRAVTRE